MPICMLSTLLVGGRDISVVQYMAQFFLFTITNFNCIFNNALFKSKFEGMYIQKNEKCDLAKD